MSGVSGARQPSQPKTGCRGAPKFLATTQTASTSYGVLFNKRVVLTVFKSHFLVSLQLRTRTRPL